LAREGAFEDALAEAGGAGQAVVDGGFGGFDLRELFGDLGDDFGLFFDWRDRKRHSGKLCGTQMIDTHASGSLGKELAGVVMEKHG
jgi:hypothetical protein